MLKLDEKNIKAEELRKGNFVMLWKAQNYFAPISGCNGGLVFFDDVPTIRKDIDIGLDDLKPIPITEEWLLRLGFKKAERGNIIQYEDNFESSHEFNSDGTFGYCIGVQHWIDLKYVHQLQNLVFALTQEELKSPSM